MSLKQILTIDIETVSTTSDKEDALNQFKNKITVIGVGNIAGLRQTYRNLEEFKKDIWLSPSFVFCGHNLKWDLKQLIHHLGCMPANGLKAYHDDTRLMAFTCTDKISDAYLVIYEAQRQQKNSELPQGYTHREAKLHSLKTLAPFFLDVSPFWEDPTNHDSDEYVLKDVEYTTELKHFFTHRLQELKQYRFYKEKMMPWARMLLQAELEGVTLNQPALEELSGLTDIQVKTLRDTINSQWAEEAKDYSKLQYEALQQKYQSMFEVALAKPTKKQKNVEQLQQRYAGLYEKAVQTADVNLNLDSPSQLKWLLKDKLNLDIRNFEGKDSTDKEVLQRLSKQDPKVKNLLEYRKVQKLATAFIPSYQTLQREGKLYPSFNQDGTRTGRLSSSGPNLQQVPRHLKHLFQASEGKHLVTFDLSAIEPMVLAHFSGDSGLEKIVMNNQSFHSLNAIALFNLSCSEAVVKDQFPQFRSIAKTVGLAVLYGAGWRQIQMACLKEGVEFSESECRQAVYRIRETYNGVWEFKEALDNELSNGTIIYNLLGRPLKIYNQDDIYMKGLNTLIQSSASDLCLETARQIADIPGCKPIMFIHDSVVTEVDQESRLKQIEELFTQWQLGQGDNKYHTRCEGGISSVWE